MSDDRIYTVYPYRSGKPPTTNRKSKFWIITAVIVCYVVLVGIIVLVVLLTPKNEIPKEVQNGLFNKTEKSIMHPPTIRPFRPSQRDPVGILPIPVVRDYSGIINPRTNDRTKYPGRYPDPDGWKETEREKQRKFVIEAGFSRYDVAQGK